MQFVEGLFAGMGFADLCARSPLCVCRCGHSPCSVYNLHVVVWHDGEEERSWRHEEGMTIDLLLWSYNAC